MDEHAEAVDGAAAARPRRPAAAPSRSGWYTRSATTWPACSSAGSNGSSSRAHADRRGVDDDRRRRRCRRPCRPGRPRPARRRLGRVRRRPVDDDDVGGAGAAEGVDDAARRGAGADHGDARRRRRATPAVGQRGDEAVAVGAVADERAVADARPPCSPSAAPPPPGPARRRPRRRPPCAASSPTARRCRARASASSARGGAAGRDVEGDVHPVEPAGGERRVVHRRRQRVPDRASR